MKLVALTHTQCIKVALMKIEYLVSISLILFVTGFKGFSGDNQDKGGSSA